MKPRARIAPYGWKAQGTPQSIASGARAGTRVIYAVGPDGATIEFIQPSAEQAEVVARGGEDEVGRIALCSAQEVAAEMAVALHVADHRLDGAAAPPLAANGGRDPTLLA